MIKRLIPLLVVIVAACDHTTAPRPCPTSSASLGSAFRGVSLRAPTFARASSAQTDLTNMNVGDVRVLDPADIPNGVNFPQGPTVQQFLMIVGNTNPQHDSVANYVVRADRSSDVSITSYRSPPALPAAVRVTGNVLTRKSPAEAVHNKIRDFERKGLTLRGASRAESVTGISAQSNVQLADLCNAAVGDTLSLKIPNAATNNLCNNFVSTKAVVASVSRRAIIAIDTLDGDYRSLFPAVVLDSIANEFDAITFPTDSSYYNTPTDIDNNGRVIMLFTGQINKLTPPNTSGSFIGGFFFAGDFFPTTGTKENTFCPQSNRGEIFYLLSPDASGKFGNVRSPSSVRQGTRGTIAHEFQHMINAGNRFQNPAVTEFESTWLDEALAHFAEDAVGRVQRGFGDLQTLDHNSILPCSPCSPANDYDAFFFQNLARLTFWMANPDEFAPTSESADTSLAVRGAAWALVRYAADNYSGGNPRALTRKLAAGPDTGVVNLTAASGASIDTLVAGWLVSMYADHRGIPGIASKYQYRSYNFQSVMPPVAKAELNQAIPAYPLVVQSIGTGVDSIPGKNRSGSGTYYMLTVAPGTGVKTVQIQDQSGAVASFPGEHVYVLRVQ